MVGGREKVTGGFNRATDARRQTGSAFKPFVYAAAMDLGFQYDSTVEDAPFTIDIPGSGPYTPKNYSRDFKGMMTLTDALSQSINTVAVKVSEAVGRDNVRDVATRFGIDNALADGPALALGASESTLLEMTGAYAGILNGGNAVQPYGLTELRLKGDSGPLMGKEGGIGERVITPQAAQQLTYMMHRVVTDGTGTGGGLPADIWRETVTRLSADLPPQPLPMIRPAQPPRVVPIAPQGQTTTTRRPTQEQRRQTTEDVILDVLGRIFGN